MRFANPAGLWLAALAVPVVLLHVLRPRRQSRPVSSVLLWREVAQPVSAATPWQRLRPSVLLALQLAAVALLAGAAARPVRLTDVPLAPHTVFIVDASGSMAAADGDPDRMGEARARARELRDRIPAGGMASVVVASSQPRVVLSASPDRGAFDDALAPLRASAGGADFPTAFSMAESLETPEVPIGFVLVSDGGLADAERGLIPPGTRYERVGERATNRAITRLGVEPRDGGLVARLTLANTGGGDASQRVRLDVDGRTRASFDVDLERGAVVDRAVDLPDGDRVEAYLEGEDLLLADDHYRAVAGGRRALKVLLAGPDDVFLQRLLEALPGVTVERSAESRPAAGFDLAVYDRVPVPADPGAPFLAIAPEGGSPGVAVTGTVERPAVTLVRAEDPLLADLDLAEVAVAQAQRLRPGPADQVLVAAEGTPLLVRGERRGLPFAYLGFPLDQSNLPLQVAFPILGNRLVDDLAGAAVPTGDLRVGDALPVIGGEGVSVEGPDATTAAVPLGATPPVADRPGFWVVRQGGRPDQVLAVNPAAAESALAPAPRLPIEPAAAPRPGG
ncbi:MAG: vWA domain-containing protein, partial [Acidimicrobiales bacterium]